jgi:hypothetical protein
LCQAVASTDAVRRLVPALAIDQGFRPSELGVLKPGWVRLR